MWVATFGLVFTQPCCSFFLTRSGNTARLVQNTHTTQPINGWPAAAVKSIWEQQLILSWHWYDKKKNGVKLTKSNMFFFGYHLNRMWFKKKREAEEKLLWLQFLVFYKKKKLQSDWWLQTVGQERFCCSESAATPLDQMESVDWQSELWQSRDEDHTSAPTVGEIICVLSAVTENKRLKFFFVGNEIQLSAAGGGTNAASDHLLEKQNVRVQSPTILARSTAAAPPCCAQLGGNDLRFLPQLCSICHDTPVHMFYHHGVTMATGWC